MSMPEAVQKSQRKRTRLQPCLIVWFWMTALVFSISYCADCFLFERGNVPDAGPPRTVASDTAGTTSSSIDRVIQQHRWNSLPLLLSISAGAAALLPLGMWFGVIRRED